MSFMQIMRIRRLCIAACLATAMPVVARGAETDGMYAGRWDGLCGEELKKAVAADCRPVGFVESFLGQGGYWAILAQTDMAIGGTGYLNRFSADALPYPESFNVGPRDVSLVQVIPAEWWSVQSSMQSYIVRDLYNMVPALYDVGGLKGVYPPGTVTDASFSNGLWSVGLGLFDGVSRHLWQPPYGYEGDVARIVFYLFTVYPDGLVPFGLNGALYVDSSYYPGISEPALRQLLTWHRNDPVDALERGRNDMFARYQGNANPFVEFPALAEFLWGKLKGMPFGDDAGGDSAVAQLKATYSVSEQRINLCSDHIPDEAVWMVDGVDVSQSYIVPSELGIGVHELRFFCPQSHGRLLIEIVP